MPTADAEGWMESEGSIGEASARRVFTHLQIDHGSSAFAVGMLRDCCLRSLQSIIEKRGKAKIKKKHGCKQHVVRGLYTHRAMQVPSTRGRMGAAHLCVRAFVRSIPIFRNFSGHADGECQGLDRIGG